MCNRLEFTQGALMSDREFILTVSCPDKPGINYAVSGFLVQHGGNMLQSKQFNDRQGGGFFLRLHFSAPHEIEELRQAFGAVAESFRMTWRLNDAAAPTRTLVLVSKFGHCMNDLLYRRQVGGLKIEIPAIVSNHRDLEPLAASYGVPFHHVPVTAGGKAEAEARILELFAEYQADLLVLARYMQILSDDLCKRLEGRAINIHHSFLPGFKGAKPYHQAHERGVKLIGATAHYVTGDLDEGPIIEQDVARVDHELDPDDLVAAGRDVESQVLARALKWHSEHRVLLNGSRTVVFH
jgi:formyltetrahydrofolate deformylase